MGLREFFEGLKARKTKLPTLVEIKDENIQENNAGERTGTLTPGQDYFTVRVNEMFLANERKWFSEIEPMVVCLTSYIYGAQEIDNPFIVGRNLLKSKLKEIPQGLVFRDTRVAGVHPFSGGRLTVGIVLCENEVSNQLTDSLEFLESISGVVSENIKCLASIYLPIANVILGGIDKLLESRQLVPVFGFRREFDADSPDGIHSGYFAMIEGNQNGLDKDKLFVKGNQLYYGKTIDDAVEFYRHDKFKESDYFLFSINRSETRGDIKTLPVTRQYNRILDELKSVPEVSQDHKERIKSMLRVLSIEMRQSPDLTAHQATLLMDNYVAEVKELIAPKYNFGSGLKLTEDEWSSIDKSIVSL